MSEISIKIIKSRRRTLAIQVKPEGVIVRAPLFASDREIKKFVNAHADWIRKQTARISAEDRKRENIRKLGDKELAELKKKAAAVIPERVGYYAPLIGVDYGRVTIRSQKTRWGSCSAKGNLNFNCLLLLAPPVVLDSVVVHELCHRKEMNHSQRFYAEVLRVFPEYYKWNAWLKKNGRDLLAVL